MIRCGGCCLLLIFALAPAFALAQESKNGSATYDNQPADAWLARLQDTEAPLPLRIRAAYALGQIRPAGSQAVAALIKGVDDRAQEVRWYSADSLGRIGPAAKDGVTVLLDGVKDPANDKPFQRIAAAALGKIGADAEPAVPWLLEALQGSDAPLQAAAALALWRIKKHPETLPALTKLLAEPSGEGAHLASLALLELGAEARPAAADLVRTLGHASPDARRAAAKVLSKLGPEMFPPLSKVLGGTQETERTEAILAALVFLIDEARLGALYNPRATSDEFAAAENCLEAALPALLKLFGDSNEAVRSVALLAAAKTGLAAVPALVAALSEGSDESKAAAALALARLEDYLPHGVSSPHITTLQRKAAAPLVVALRSKETAVRSAALKIFAELSWGPEAQEALPLLREALKSEDPIMRRNAAKALEQVQKSVARP